MNQPFKTPRRIQFEYLVGYDVESNMFYWATIWAGSKYDACLLMGNKIIRLYGINALVRKDHQQEFYDELAEVLD